ncbi:MAG: NrfD/PsrC family molybdoenzyme membrane anchor subunit [Hyphomicrobiales bacterium]|nr:NrfD/PsrC family molybdoenzyme membrane anchor subunit [Hyphomicrobiales bacterium]
METLPNLAPYTGWVYPNETVFEWSVLIAVYPYLTGLVAGAFTVSSLYQVFGFKRLKPVAHLALLTSLCFMIFVPSPLLLHLGHPERAFNATLTPHWTSAMAMFGYFASAYVVLLLIETWFAYRPFIVGEAQRRQDLLGRFYRVLTLGSYDLSEHAMRYDRKWLFALAVIGIPGAHGLHGYVGFMYGSLKSREWWSSDLMPVIFLFSAIISGVALLVVLYVASCKLRKIPVDLACLKGLAYTIWAFIMVAIALEALEFANLVYKGREGIEIILEYVTGRLLIPYFVLQFAIGAITPFFVLSYMIWRGTTGRALVVGVTLSACLVLFSVFMMRWNVVIGGQEISKTGKGLLYYQPLILSKEGLVVAALLTIAPVILLLGLARLFPPFEEAETTAPSAAAAQQAMNS